MRSAWGTFPQQSAVKKQRFRIRFSTYSISLMHHSWVVTRLLQAVFRLSSNKRVFSESPHRDLGGDTRSVPKFIVSKKIFVKKPSSQPSTKKDLNFKLLLSPPNWRRYQRSAWGASPQHSAVQKQRFCPPFPAVSTYAMHNSWVVTRVIQAVFRLPSYKGAYPASPDRDLDGEPTFGRNFPKRDENFQ